MLSNETKIRLPRLISDGMILQRNAQVKIWGWAPEEETIIIRFMELVLQTTANQKGEWSVTFPSKEAGGPYEMVIEGKESKEVLTVKNILLGDIWVCSGQSNMEMKMLSVKEKYPEEIEKANFDAIRQFLVPVVYDFNKPLEDIETGNWEVANSQSVLDFTAAGYFFAKKIYETYHIPIGLLNASLGGAPAEAFVSKEGLSQFPEYLEASKEWMDQEHVDAALKRNEEMAEEWYRQINQKDLGLKEEGGLYYAKELNESDWKSIHVPSYWEEEGAGAFNGVVWFRKEVELPAGLALDQAKLIFGNVVDEDTVYINGVKVGTTPMQYIPRRYDIFAGVLNEGKNTIAVRLVSQSGKGGFYKDKPYELVIGNHVIDLTGEWKYAIGAKSEPMQAPTFVMWQPTGLYHGMIAPLLSYTIKGALWYQGESNAQRPDDYEKLLTALIEDWRAKWGIGEFPFLYVQLPNFAEPSHSPAASHWAQIREAQRKVLEVPNTGMAVTLDVGEWNDIHPVSKKEVGDRLALVAEKEVYGNSTLVAFPLFQKASKEGNQVRLYFEETGSGLVTKDGKAPKHFAIAGEDKVFEWADAKIEGDTVVVWKDQIPNPVYVHYAWADNPEGANLYNKEGLPASTFETEVR